VEAAEVGLGIAPLIMLVVALAVLAVLI